MEPFRVQNNFTIFLSTIEYNLSRFSPKECICLKATTLVTIFTRLGGWNNRNMKIEKHRPPHKSLSSLLQNALAVVLWHSISSFTVFSCLCFFSMSLSISHSPCIHHYILIVPFSFFSVYTLSVTHSSFCATSLFVPASTC